MLRVDIRELRQGPVDTSGVIDPADPVLEGLNLAFLEPVRVTGTLQLTEDDDILWRGAFQTRTRAECRRCLAPIEESIAETVDVLLSADPELAEDPSVYVLPADQREVDVAPVVREELALRVPAFSLCRPDCRGLCATCGADLNAGPCEHARSGSTD